MGVLVALYLAAGLIGSIWAFNILAGRAGIIIVFLLVSSCSALVTDVRCSSNGSFNVFEPGAIRSGYCRLLQYPHAPTSAISIALTVGLFLAPAVIVGAVLVQHARKNLARRIVRIVVGAQALAVASSIALLPLAHVGHNNV